MHLPNRVEKKYFINYLITSVIYEPEANFMKNIVTVAKVSGRRYRVREIMLISSMTMNKRALSWMQRESRNQMCFSTHE